MINEGEISEINVKLKKKIKNCEIIINIFEFVKK